MTDNTNPLRICDYLANPRNIPLKKLVGLTRDYYQQAEATADNHLSPSHGWYYRLACECERRGLNLDRVLRHSPTEAKQ